jgi:glycosyltransferase involved in cell wall biosynthesis
MDNRTINALEQLGAKPLKYTLQGTRLNPIKDIRSIFQLQNIIRTFDIDLVFPYTIKPVIYGSIASRLTKTQIISLITGLGYTFSESSLKSKILGGITRILYKIALNTNKAVIFQNRDDQQLFIEKAIINNQIRTEIVDGSGVNLNKYPFRIRKHQTDKLKFVLVARMILEKGVHLFMQSAKEIKKLHPDIEFHLVGPIVSSPSAIHKEQILEFERNQIIVYHGSVENVSAILKDCDVFVLPTYYREGVPRSILEALSIGMPIITTDTPGCRETVEEGINGFLIEPKDQESLTQSMLKVIDKQSYINTMGKASRLLAEKRFDVRIINTQILEIINEVINN